MPQGICPLGNIGFPVVVSGLPNVQTKTQPSDLDLRFGPAATLTWDTKTGNIDVPGSHTFFLQGDLYSLNAVRLCKPVYNGQEEGSEARIAELQLWGAPPATSANVEAQLAVLILPIYEAPAFSPEAKALYAALFEKKQSSLLSFIPERQSVLRYNTCVEILNNTYKNIAVAYWRKGIAWLKNDASLPRSASLPASGIPLSLTTNVLVPNTLKENPDGTKVPGRGLQMDSVSVPYTKNIQADSSDYETRFRLMTFQKTRPPAPSSLSVGDFKCVAIDRSKDIQEGRIRIDPKTGETMETMEETLTEEQKTKQDLSLNNLPETKYKAKDIEDTVGIILGVILGIFLLALVVLGIQRLVTRKTDADLLKTTMAAAAVVSSFKVEWIDLLVPFFLGITAVCILTILIIILMVNK